MPTLQEVSANKAELKASPRVNPKTGAVADFLKYLKSPKSSQQMQALMGVLPFVDDLETVLEDASYGRAPVQGKGMTLGLTPEGKSMVELATIFAPGGRAASQAAESGAMALGRVGEQYAERKVPEVMARGGRPAQLLSDLAKGTISPATVFHGSPHRFTKFDSSKIGTGEGNQTYGYGLYLAENPATAQSYKQALSEPELFVGGKKLQPEAGSPSDVASAWLQDVFDRGFFRSKTADPFDQAIADIQKAPVPDKEAVIQAVKDLKAKGATMRPGGNVYQVDLPDEQIAKMLDYDKPLNKQAKPVREALSKLGIAVDDRKMGEYEDALLGALMSDAPAGPLPRQPVNMTGGEILKELQRNPSRYLPQVMQGRELTQAMINPAQGASSVLRQAGIPGIRYLDEGSRSNFRVQNTVKGQPYGEPVSFMTERQAQDYIKEQVKKGFGTEMLPGTSNFVVFPGMEDMLRIDKINDSPLDLFLQNYKP